MDRSQLPDAALAPLALALVPGVGPVAWRRLVAEHDGAAGALEHRVGARAAAEARAKARALLDRCADGGIAVVTPVDESYPSALLALEDPPTPLFAIGALALAAMPSVAIVGSRHATAYGRRTARRFAATIAADGVCVVSGLAAGIDAESHRGALDAAGATIAVLGTGVDVAYPVSNAPLHAAVAERGLVVAELPPGRGAHAGAFPRRNRLIAALADVVVVVEAGHRSGALITAQLGDALARPVAAVPGPIDVATSQGTNQLLRDGVHAVTSPEDVLALLSLTARGRSWGRRAPEAASHPDARHSSPAAPPGSPEHRILQVLDAGPQLADDLARVAAAAPRDVGAALSLLSIAGLVTIDPAGLVRRA